MQEIRNVIINLIKMHIIEVGRKSPTYCKFHAKGRDIFIMYKILYSEGLPMIKKQ